MSPHDGYSCAEAETRISDLERELAHEREMSKVKARVSRRIVDASIKAHAALDEARDVLTSARPHCLYTSVEGDIDEWLAANPPLHNGDQIAGNTPDQPENEPDSR